jgi:hypothetical protein
MINERNFKLQQQQVNNLEAHRRHTREMTEKTLEFKKAEARNDEEGTWNFTAPDGTQMKQDWEERDGKREPTGDPYTRFKPTNKEAARQKKIEAMRFDQADVYSMPPLEKEQLEKARKNKLSYTETYPQAHTFNARDREITLARYKTFVSQGQEGYNVDTPWDIQEEEFIGFQADIDAIQEARKKLAGTKHFSKDPLFGLGNEPLKENYASLVQEGKQSLEDVEMKDQFGREWTDPEAKAAARTKQVEVIRAYARTLKEARRAAEAALGRVEEDKKEWVKRREVARATQESELTEAEQRRMFREKRMGVAEKEKEMMRAPAIIKQRKQFLERLNPPKTRQEEELEELLRKAANPLDSNDMFRSWYE